MKLTLTINKEYIIPKGFNEVVSMLEAIAEAPFSNDRYTVFGNMDSSEELQFYFMAKWSSMGRQPKFADNASTQIIVRPEKINDISTRLVVETKTNPAIYIFISVLLIILFISFFFNNIQKDLESIAITLALMMVAFLLDRFIKNMLIGSFEDAINMKDGKK